MRIWNPEDKRLRMPLAAANLIGAGLLLLANRSGHFDTAEALRRAINPNANKPVPTIQIIPTTQPQETEGTLPMDVAKMIIESKCQVQFLSPSHTGKAKFVQAAIMQQKPGTNGLNIQDLEPMVNIPTDPTGGVNESGYWEAEEDFAFVRPVYVPQNDQLNLAEGSAATIETGIIHKGEKFFSGLVYTGGIANGNIAAYARSNVYEVKAVGAGDACNVAPALMLAYLHNPGMDQGAAGQIQQELNK